MVETTGDVISAKCYSQTVTTNKPTFNILQAGCPSNRLTTGSQPALILPSELYFSNTNQI